VTVPHGASDNVPERAWAHDHVIAAGEPAAADLAAGLAGLRFISTALRRCAWFWCATAVAGLLIGLGLRLVLPPADQASTSILLTPRPDQNAPEAMQDDAALLQSRTVAGRALHKLGLRQSADSLVAASTVTTVTDRVLLLTVTAPSSNEAVRRADALATEFLQVRADQLLAQQQLVLTALSRRSNPAQQQAESLARQITSVSAQASSPAQQAKLKDLRVQLGRANDALDGLKGVGLAYQVNTMSAVKDSKVLDTAAPVWPGKHETPGLGLGLAILAAAIGLIPGLALGLGIVIVRALVSDRLRRRDDVAHALGAPVDLSVSSVHVGRWLPGRRGLAAARCHDMQRIVAHLRDAVPKSSRGAAALAVVPADNAQVAALSLVSLAVSCAQEGKQVVVADLSRGARAARLLGAGNPGVGAVRVNGVHLVVAVPDRDDVLPVGPLHRTSPQAQPGPASEALAAAYASADLLLTLVTLDPALGGGHLATWAAGAVVVVTAGRSSSTRIHAVGEMIRLAGTPLVSAVLVGADKTDESLGATPTQLPIQPDPGGHDLPSLGPHRHLSRRRG